MANYNRQGTAPIEEGDSLSPVEVEAEFNSIQTVLNGGLDNANLDGSAGITGANIAATTITGAKVAASTITKAKIAQDATSQVSFNKNAGAASLTSTTDYQDCPNTSDITVANLAAEEDWIMMSYSGSFVNNHTGNITLTLTFDIDGTDQSDLTRHELGQTDEFHFNMHFFHKATLDSHTIRPRIKMDSANSNMAAVTAVFTTFGAFSIPAK